MNKTIGMTIVGLALLLAVVPAFVYAKKAEKTMNGGGQIIEGDYKVSFGGNVKEIGEESWRGQMQVNFHNVSNGNVAGGKFHSTGITAANWYDSNSATCTAAMNVTMDGKFNGQDGWRLIFRAGDNEDTMRVTLYGPGGGMEYDTHASDFGNESNCVGNARTGLDRGNIKIGR